MLSLIAVLLALALGLTFVGACAPFRFGCNWQTCFFLFLGQGLGLGLTSLAWFASWWLFGAYQKPALLLEMVMLGASAYVFYRRRGLPEVARPKVNGFSGVAGPLALISAGVAAVAALLYFLTSSAGLPHGEWDAWSIWNLHARFLFLGKGDAWKVMFSPEFFYSHPDYPLLLPMSIVRIWIFQGADRVLGPQIVAFLFTFATAGLVASAVAVLRGPIQGCLALVGLLATGPYVHLGAAQYADVPLSFFIANTIALLVCFDESDGRSSGFMLLAGVSAGLAAWTKNEGLLFLLAAAASRIPTLWIKRKDRSQRRAMWCFALGFAVPVALTVAFKIALAPPGDIVTWMRGPGLWKHLLDFERLGIILRALAIGLWKFGGWFPGIIVVGCVYAACFGTVRVRQQRSAAFRGWSVLVLMLIGDVAVYLFGQNDIVWWLNTSADRLLMQLWPAALFLFFTLIRVPEPRPQQGMTSQKTLDR